jgi:hypothetical protein
LIERLAAHPVEEAAPDGLADFQRASGQLDKAVGEAYNAAIALKGMWDKFEAIPKKQQGMYDDLGRLMSTLAKAAGESHHIAGRLRKYR